MCWKCSLGTGYSGVVVSEGKAVTMFSDGKMDYLIALSSNDGKEIWRLPLGETFPPRDGSSGGPVSTPAIDHGVVFALGPHGNLVAAQLGTGKKYLASGPRSTQRCDTTLGIHNFPISDWRFCCRVYRRYAKSRGHCT